MNLVFKFFSFIFMFFIATNIFAAPININTAKQVAQNFCKGKMTNAVKAESVNLIYSQTIENQDVVFYVFSIEPKGFVIVSADDRVMPILGYSTESNFSVLEIPNNVKWWLDSYKKKIKIVVGKDMKPTEKTASLWQKYLSDNVDYQTNNSAKSVLPLCATTWDQMPYYNDSCPQGVPSGCVATAVTQIMKYWNWPITGEGSNSYIPQDHPEYGLQSADFANATYNWAMMPNNVVAPNAEVAKITYHFGVAVEMNYGPNGSGAYSHKAAIALLDNFKYDEDKMQMWYRDYTWDPYLDELVEYPWAEQDWIDTLKLEIDNGRPIYYAGDDGTAGHAFVCDGYDNNDYFHFNWGWGGSYDGYFSVNDLYPEGQGIGGNQDGFTNGQQIITHIEPFYNGYTPNNIQRNLGMQSNITLSDNIVNNYNGLTVEATIKNFDTQTFNGSLSAVIFTTGGILIQAVETLENITLTANGQNTFTFTNAMLNTGISGHFIVRIIYQQNNSFNWYYVEDDNSYINYADLEIQYLKQLQLNSDITYNSPLAYNKPITINFDVVNNSPVDFTGFIRVYFWDENFTNNYNIDTYTASTPLQPNENFQPNGITLTDSALDVPPGNYYLCVYYRSTGGWDMVGDDNFSNRIPVTVLSSVPYLVFDSPIIVTPSTIDQGGNFTVNATIKNIGADLNNGMLRAVTQKGGGSNTIIETLSNIKLYTNEAKSFTFQLNNCKLSPSVYNVEIYYTPNTLSNLTKIENSTAKITVLDTSTNININTENIIESRIYPNPSHNGIFTIEISENISKAKIEVYNMLGTKIFEQNINYQVQNISLNLPDGMYYYYIKDINNEQKSSGKIIVKK